MLLTIVLNNFDLMDKLIDKGIKEMQSTSTLSSNFTITKEARTEIYIGITNIFVSNTIDNEFIPTMIKSYLRGYDAGKRSTEKTKRNSRYYW